MGFVELENMGKAALEQFPVIKRSAKRVYQLASVAASNEKFKSEGDVVRVSPNDGFEYFYGYYDKSPWDATDRYMICIKVKQAYKSVAPKEPGVVGVIDTQDGNKFIKIGVTHSWNVQQSCMAQWMGPDFETKIIYNDFRDSRYCSVIYNWAEKHEEAVLPLPVYDVARDGSFALSLDFSRLHRMRPGYGYSNLPEMTKGELCPDKTCIWKMDIPSGKITDLFKYTDMAAFEPDESMQGAEHKVNHLMISPNGKRFMVLHRWFQKGRKHTRLVTVNVDKTEMYNLSDDVFVSHCYWKNDHEILSFLRKKETGNHYYLMKDQTQEYKMYWPELNTDGHCSYSPDGKFIITDTYPNRKRIASVYLCTEEDNCSRRIARVWAPFRYDNDCRCDLHPRWNRKGDKVCIDSVHEGRRGLYIVRVPSLNKVCANDSVVSVVVPCYNAGKFLKETLSSLENQTYKNIEIICVNDGSTDNTLEILENYSREHKNVTVVNQPNSGVSKARNNGLLHAKGKYVVFCDSDDLVKENFIEALVVSKESECSDTAYCLLKRKKTEVFSYTKEPEMQLQNQEQAMHNLLFRMPEIAFTCYLFDVKTIKENEIKFDEDTKYGEDREFNWKYLCHCKKISFVNAPLYYYRVNQESATKKKASWRKTDLLSAVRRIEDYLKSSNCEFYSVFKDYMYARATWTVAKTFAISNDADLYKKFIKEYDVKAGMKRMTKDTNKLVCLSSLLYLVNPWLYFKCISILKK